MIVSFEKTRSGFCVAGEWRTATAHEYAVYADRAGRWAAVQVVEYGEWSEYTEEEARDYFPAALVSAIDAILKGGI